MKTKALLHRFGWVLAVVVLLSAVTAGYLLGRSTGDGTPDIPPGETVIDTGTETIWTCSMHPQIRQPEPGQCPICGMDLIPVDDEAGSEELGPRQIQLSPYAEKLADIRTAIVKRQFIEHEITALGEVAHDETRMKHITTWIPGRIDRLYVDYTGETVHAGDRLADIYSPPLYAAQEEYLQTIHTAETLSGASLASTRGTAELTVIAAYEKLRLLGMTDNQISELEQRGTPAEHVTIYSKFDGVVTDRNATGGMYVDTGTRIYTVVDLSVVWVELAVYETELPWIETGQDVSFTTASYPGETFTGHIAFIDPEVDRRTRTVDVRVEVPNPGGRLKPDMFVDAAIHSTLAGNGDVLDGGAAETVSDAPLVIPRSAPLITGKRAVVYVRSDDQPGVYEGREIVLGPRAGDYYLVKEGLAVNEEVVVNGSFKIDSALQILAKPSMMQPAGGLSLAAMHDHGQGGEMDSAEPMDDMDDMEAMNHDDHEAMPSADTADGSPSFDASDAFLQQLEGVYDGYFGIRTALSGDDHGAAVSAAERMHTALEKVDMTLLGHDAHMAWMEQLPILTSQASSIAGSGDIEAARRAFGPLSEAVIAVADMFGHSGERTFYRFHCPMAFDNAGADWLQVDSELKNPFFGSSMLTCGSPVRTYPESDNEQQ